MEFAANLDKSKLSNSHRCNQRKSDSTRINKRTKKYIYANEADLLNVAMFGKTAKHWRDENPDKSGNIRDYASIEQLVILSNMESINALLIRNGLEQSERLIQLNSVAKTQMTSLIDNLTMKKLK